jgi:hypothetical protein
MPSPDNFRSYTGNYRYIPAIRLVIHMSPVKGWPAKRGTQCSTSSKGREPAITDTAGWHRMARGRHLSFTSFSLDGNQLCDGSPIVTGDKEALPFRNAVQSSVQSTEVARSD